MLLLFAAWIVTGLVPAVPMPRLMPPAVDREKPGPLPTLSGPVRVPPVRGRSRDAVPVSVPVRVVIVADGAVIGPLDVSPGT